MNTKHEIVELVAELAMTDCEQTFFPEHIDRQATYSTIASNIVEYFGEQFEYNIIAMTTVTALVVENFLLSLENQILKGAK